MKKMIPKKKQEPNAPTYELGVQSKSYLSIQFTRYSLSVTTGLNSFF